MPEHTLSAEPTHSRWNRALPPRLSINSGDTVISNASTPAARKSIPA